MTHIVKSRDIIREIEADGWVLDRVRGSHHVFKHPARPGHISVPHPKSDLGPGIVAQIRKAAAGVRETPDTKQEMGMRYPVAIEPATDAACYGVAVPDLPGCFSAGDTLDAALPGAEESAAAWIDATLDAGGPVPPPSSVEAIRNNPDYAGWIFGLITVDTGLFDDTVERVNITLPRRVILRLDALARAAGESRSGYIARHVTFPGRPATDGMGRPAAKQ